MGGGAVAHLAPLGYASVSFICSTWHCNAHINFDNPQNGGPKF